MKNNRTFLDKLLDGAEVKWKPLGKITDIKTGQPVSKHSISQNPGIYPVINSGREPLGFINEWNTEDDPIGITTRGAGVGSITWQEGKYFRGNLNYSVTIKSQNELSIRFLYHILLHFQKEIHNLCSFTGIPALNASELKKLIIPVPPLHIQTEIVRILDTLTALTSELTSELILRQKQYEYYREKLLSFDSLERLNEGGAKKKVIDVAIYAKSRINVNMLNSDNYVGVDNLLQNKMGKTVSNYVPLEGSFIEYIPNDILIGNIRPYLRKIWQADRKGGTNGDVLVIRSIDKNISPRYLYHILADESFFEYNTKYSKGAKMPRGDKSAILQYEFYVPPLEEQHRIVSILDKFETLTNSITEGLPLAIEQSQKRYEYYRELLLNF
ncbi:restriction endonuclease subunit S [Aggregatibacter actinomycetemcomitans]|uniref:restriction endonuclease subunit S n=1 Tax=Aggregatibacter actinomycetemcomitans TaxID=714 RepID=UPI00197B45F7|nr:restriction endonuclease subunit S [Aggregatibacter actinomycetemcomitans]MBN6077339.1 restriction endonuclease subunit S [Aggregatibacter actinomycetemcomitans]